MNKLLLLTAALAAIFASGCGGGGINDDSGAGTGPVYLRVVQASPNAGAVDVEVRSALFGTAAYTGSFPSAGQSAATIANGPATFDFLSTGTSNVLLSDGATLEGGNIYTEILAGRVGGGTSDPLQALLVSDRRSELDPTKAYDRFVNASPLLDAVDVYVTAPSASIDTASPTVTNLGRYKISGRIVMPTGPVRIRVTATGSKTPVIDVTTTVAVGTYAVAVTENNDANTGANLNSYVGHL